MGLQNGFDLVNRDLPSIIKGVERLRERCPTLRTLEALIAFAGSVVLVSFRMITVGTLHDALTDSSDADDKSHVCLVHNPFLLPQSAWYTKSLPTFADALALVRQQFWHVQTFQSSGLDEEVVKVPRGLFNTWSHLLCYAA